MTEYIREIVERLKSIQDSTERRASVDQGDTTVNLTRSTADTAGTEETVSRTVGDGTFRYRTDSYRHTQYRHPIQAFFDVAITATNSPVDPGETLTVDYSVENTGNADGTQTITLDIDSTQEDSESQTLTFKTSANSSLDWQTQAGDAGNFTATVASDDDTATASVTVLPPSAILAYDPTTYSGGDTTWADQAGTAQDMSLTGIQTATLSDGSAALSSDGVDDNGLTTLPSALEGSSLQNFAVEFEVEYTDGALSVVAGAVNSGDDQRLQILANFDYDTFSTVAGQIGCQIKDVNGEDIFVSPASNPNLDDGTRHTVVFDVIDASNTNVDIYIDGTAQSLSFGAQQNPNSFTTWDVDMAHFARNKGGTIDNHYPGKLGNVRWHDSDIGGPTV